MIASTSNQHLQQSLFAGINAIIHHAGLSSPKLTNGVLQTFRTRLFRSQTAEYMDQKKLEVRALPVPLLALVPRARTRLARTSRASFPSQSCFRHPGALGEEGNGLKLEVLGLASSQCERERGRPTGEESSVRSCMPRRGAARAQAEKLNSVRSKCELIGL